MKAGSGKSCPSCGERYDGEVLFCPKDGTPLASLRNTQIAAINPLERDPYVGAELPGQIRIDSLIGIGSMGRVYRAFQGGIERDVAVKVLHRELSGNAELTARFHREAKVSSRLVHPNVVQVLMTGALPAGEARGGELYLVMEFLDGISLLSALAAAGEGAALPLPRALHVALQICDAVGEAHAQGIVHRDLKPENVMLVRRGDDPDYVKVLDFGIARLEWADRAVSTQAGLIFGTAKYISPEGAEGHQVGPSADVYSIATMLYQMLAGRTPFEGDSPVALLVQHTHAPPLELRSIARASYVPAPLSAAIMANLAKKPAERAQNARVFARDLVAAARASGLYPEEIATQSTLFSPTSFGAVKLASKERTRAHELSAEIAAKIGGVSPAAIAAAQAPPTSTPGGAPALSSAAALAHAAAAGAAGRTPTRPPALPPVQPTAVSRTVVGEEHEDVDASELVPDSMAGARAVPPARTSQSRAGVTGIADAHGSGEHRLSEPTPEPRPSHAPGRTVLDEDNPSATLPGTPLGAEPAPPSADLSGQLTTMQGTETTLEKPVMSRRAPSGRAKQARVAAIVACVLLGVPALVFAGRRAGVFGSASSSESIDQTLEDARDCMRRRAWDAPAEKNFKTLTDGAVEKWPTSVALADLRRQAAGLLVNDALARKYANDPAEAAHLVELALHFDPSLTTAQHLQQELAPPSKETEAPPATSSSADKKASKREARNDPGPRPSGKGPSSTPGPTTAAPPPPAPPPPPTHTAEAPASTSARPWM